MKLRAIELAVHNLGSEKAKNEFEKTAAALKKEFDLRFYPTW